jgi:poly-gamma-glutamate synthesis protein (capsule biosynthesis protein)
MKLISARGGVLLLGLLLRMPAAGSAPPADSSLVVLRFGGDVLLAGHYEQADPSARGWAFEGFTLLATADVAMVNLENAVTTRGKKIPKPYNFRMHPRYGPMLRDAGINLVTLANNHIYDYGEVGLFDTIFYLDSLNIAHVGAGRTAEEARRPVVLTRKGKHLAFFGYYGGGEAPGATASRPGVARRDLSVIGEDIAAVRSSMPGVYVVVNLHWGTEKATVPDEGQRTFARRVIDSGADVVIGHHPHVLQGIEVYRHGVIVYSLGNFLFGGNNRSSYDTGLFEIRLGQGKPVYRFLPIGVRQWRVAPLHGTDSLGVVQRVRKLSQSFSQSIFPSKESE